VGSFTVLDVPGHSPGHIALWREADRTLLCGDIFFRLLKLTAPWNFLTFDVESNHRAMRRLADLRPELVLFGHGRPLRDPDHLARVAARTRGRG
jgi:glyoxylase-like metal-dependent hydrolase (beta-lactamase superfamily II)